MSSFARLGKSRRHFWAVLKDLQCDVSAARTAQPEAGPGKRKKIVVEEVSAVATVAAVDGRGVDGRGVDGRGVDGRGVDGRGVDGRGVDGRGVDGRGVDGRGVDGRGVDGRGVDGRGVDGRGVDGRGVDGRGVVVPSYPFSAQQEPEGV